MIVLDTDHFVEISKGTSPDAIRLRNRLEAAEEQVAVTIVTGEEVLRGWFAEIRRHRDTRLQITPYARLQQTLTNLAKWLVLAWEHNAVSEYENLLVAKIRVGTLDLKIASIAKANDSLLLSRNTRDFELVPGLRLENWLE